MVLAEAEGCPYTPEKIVAKTFNCVLKLQSLLDAAIIERKRKTTVDKTWENFKKHFSEEVREHQ